MTGDILVAVHDIEPATYERCALIRDWLCDLGVDRATLLVIPAADLHPFDARRPDLADWLRERVREGDAVAQHGLQHRQLHRAGPARQAIAGLQGGRSAEFVGLDEEATRRAVRSGRRVLRLAGLEAHGFVAPAYAYTAPLREELARSFDWWAGLLRVWHGNGTGADGAGSLAGPALGLGSSSAVRRALSPSLVRAGALVQGRLLRLDLHPADFDHPRHVLALEAVLRRARRRTAITYDDLAARG
jgi:predicted deacetylase